MNNNAAWIAVVVVLVLIIGGLVVWSTSSNGGMTATSTATSTQNMSGGTSSNTPAPPTVSTDPNATVSNSTALVTGTVNPNGAQTTYWYEYGRTTALGAKTSSEPVGSGFESIAAPGYITGLTANTQYFYRLDAKNSYGTVEGGVQSFTTNTTTPPPVHLPSARTSNASGIGRFAATLNGSVDSNGVSTSYWFEYGRTPDFGNATAVQSAGNGTAFVGVNAQVAGLLPLSKYYFRIDAQNAYGTVTGATASFTTAGPAQVSLPDVTTRNATAVTNSAATLNGVVNPNDGETTYWFEYTTDPVFNQGVHTTSQKMLSANDGSTDVSADISGLSGSTQYYFRLIASNSAGTSRGGVMSFTTTPLKP